MAFFGQPPPPASWHCGSCGRSCSVVATRCSACDAPNPAGAATPAISPALAALQQHYLDLLSNAQNDDTADVVFAVEGQEIWAHKLILTTRSTYFESLLNTSGMRESNNNDNDDNEGRRTTIPLGNISVDTFRQVLRFLYTSDPGETTVEEATDLLGSADMFQLDDLKRICEIRMSQNLSIQNVLAILRLAKTTNSTSLQNVAANFILRHRYDATLQQSIRDFPITTADDGIMMQQVAASLMSNPPPAAAPRGPPAVGGFTFAASAPVAAPAAGGFGGFGGGPTFGGFGG